VPPQAFITCLRIASPARGRAVRVLAAVLALLFLGLPAWAGDLKVTVAGVRSDSGSIMIGLYDSAEGFGVAIKHATEAGLLTDKGRLAGAALRSVAGRQSIVFMGLPPGRYAIIAFHDENDNGRLDESPWGVPTEAYGFSNDAQGFLTGERGARWGRRRDHDLAHLPEDRAGTDAGERVGVALRSPPHAAAARAARRSRWRHHRELAADQGEVDGRDCTACARSRPNPRKAVRAWPVA
jgi:uncharacterized protein (DUF2141 family)